MKSEGFQRPLNISCIHDCGVYKLPTISFKQTNLFLDVGVVDDLFVKTPSKRGIEDYRRFVKLAEPNPLDVRSLEDSEAFKGLPQTLGRLGWHDLGGINAEVAHYLAVHKLQYERLRSRMRSVALPISKFGFLRQVRFGLVPRVVPALFQERIAGTTLWEMYDFAALRVASRWRPFLAIIGAQLSELISSDLVNHIDWNIKNFVFSAPTKQLTYVDLKPTMFISRQSNEHNLQGIRDYFL